MRGAVDVSAQANVGSSPFLEESNDEGPVSIRLQVSPSIFYEDDNTTTAVLRGFVAVDSYDVENGTLGALGLTASAQREVSERTSIGLNASVRSTRSPVRDFLLNPTFSQEVSPTIESGIDETDPGAFGVLDPEALDTAVLVELDPDLIEAGIRGRTSSYQAGVSLSHTLSSVDSFSLGASVRFNNSGDVAGSDYRSDRFTGSYRRTLSSRTALDAGVVVGFADYEEGSGLTRGDGTFITPTVGISHQFSETLTGSLSVGVSITEVEGPEGSNESNVGFAGSFSLCQAQFSGNLCATAARSAQATAFGGVTSVTSAAVNYGQALSLRDSIDVSARYSRRGPSASPAETEFDGSRSVFAATAGYNRMLAPRLYAFVKPSYARTFGGELSGGRENYQISFGIRYRFGILR
ncbi:hypothetical protein [Alteripontixanthobacter muriae]|uniref:hypothetical protein n=1 Tax=Alteripontixanthobacter muriae TaxID=2705546 RepID=UPI0019D69D03|nr:hypothetical protein [Alteripontixanthobacter muriae]